MAADGNGPDRRPPATVWSDTRAIRVVRLQLWPPSVDLKARIDVSKALAIGTMTVPSGWTTGWPPIPVALLAVFFAAPQVSPPSIEVLILIRLPSPKSSNSV